jgi:hypothetical protein
MNPGVSDSDAVIIDDNGCEDRRKDHAPGFPARAPTLGRRKSERRRVLFGGLVVNPEADAQVKCRIENISDRGARIRLAEPRLLPLEFWLISITAGVAYRATTVWRRDDRLGVSVHGPVDLNDPISPTERKLCTLWAAVR